MAARPHSPPSSSHAHSREAIIPNPPHPSLLSPALLHTPPSSHTPALSVPSSPLRTGELVEATKQVELSIPEEAKNFSFHQKEEKGGEVRRTERKWKSLSKQEREAFLAHAHENHEKNDYTKEHMREARKDIIKRNQEYACQAAHAPRAPPPALVALVASAPRLPPHEIY